MSDTCRPRACRMRSIPDSLPRSVFRNCYDAFVPVGRLMSPVQYERAADAVRDGRHCAGSGRLSGYSILTRLRGDNFETIIIAPV